MNDKLSYNAIVDVKKIKIKVKEAQNYLFGLLTDKYNEDKYWCLSGLMNSLSGINDLAIDLEAFNNAKENESE